MTMAATKEYGKKYLVLLSILALVFGVSFAVNNPRAAAQVIAGEIQHSEPTKASNIYNNLIWEFSVTALETTSFNEIVLDIPNNAGVGILTGSANNYVKIGSNPQMGESYFGVSRDPSTGQVVVKLNQYIDVNDGQLISVKLQFKSAVDASNVSMHPRDSNASTEEPQLPGVGTAEFTSPNYVMNGVTLNVSHQQPQGKNSLMTEISQVLVNGVEVSSAEYSWEIPEGGMTATVTLIPEYELPANARVTVKYKTTDGDAEGNLTISGSEVVPPGPNDKCVKVDTESTITASIDEPKNIFSFRTRATADGNVQMFAINLPQAKDVRVVDRPENKIIISGNEIALKGNSNYTYGRDAATGIIVVKPSSAVTVQANQEIEVQLAFEGAPNPSLFASDAASFVLVGSGNQNLADCLSVQQTDPIVTAPTGVGDFSITKQAGEPNPIFLEENQTTNYVYTFTVKNNGTSSATYPVSIFEKFNLPSGVIAKPVFTIDGVSVTPKLGAKGYEFDSTLLGNFDSGQEKTVTVEIAFTAGAPTLKAISENPSNYTCDAGSTPGGFSTTIDGTGNSADAHTLCMAELKTNYSDAPSTSVGSYVNGMDEVFTNPEPLARCGQNIAFVYDLSGSIERSKYLNTETNQWETLPSGETGATYYKQATLNLVNSLKGTATNIGLFNYGTYNSADPDSVVSTPLSVDDPQLMTAINNISTKGSQDPGGTNWEAGLRAVLDSGTHYDKVYFITDGIPTTSNQQSMGDTGFYTHTQDLNDAVKVANALKKQGTRIEGIMIESSQYYQPSTVRDDKTPASEGGEYLLKDGLTNSGGTYDREQAGINDSWARGEYYVYNGGSSVWETLKTVNSGQTQGSVKTRGGTVISTDTARWSDAQKTPIQMLQMVVGPNTGTTDVYSTQELRSFTDLNDWVQQQDLCKSKLTINKEIVDPSGNTLMEGRNWEFNVSATQPVIRNEADSNPVPFSNGVTGQGGEVSGGIHTESNPGAPITVTAAEIIPAESDYRVFTQNNKVATCTETTWNSWQNKFEEKDIATENDLTTPNGWTFDLSWEGSPRSDLRPVTCLVKNVLDEGKPRIKIEKAEYLGNGEVSTTPLAGALFNIYGSKRDSTGNYEIDYNNLVVENIHGGQLSDTTIAAGIYYLVETKAPDGLFLLAQPEQFTVQRVDNGWAVSFGMNSSLVFQKEGAPADEIWIQVADVRQGDLPKTGGNGFGSYVLLAMTLAGAGAYFARRRKIA